MLHMLLLDNIFCKNVAVQCYADHKQIYMPLSPEDGLIKF